MWFTETAANRIGQSTPAGAITEFDLPQTDSGPLGIAAGPDGALWFTEQTGNRIGRITTDGTVTEYAIPTEASAPYAITAGPDGNIWFTEQGLDPSNVGAIRQIGRVDVGSGTVTEFPVELTAGAPYGIATGPDGNLWFTMFSTNAFGYGRVGRMTPGGEVSLFRVPDRATPTDIVTGPDGGLWYTDRARSMIGRVTTDPFDEVDEDLFKICVDGEFSAAVVSGGGTIDSTLYLFDETGNGVASNDDAADGAWSEISGFPVTPGTYYLGISGYDDDPRDSSDAEIFPDEPFTGTKGPNDGAGPLDHWDDGLSSGVGAYDVHLTGATFCDQGAATTNYAESADAGKSLATAGRPAGSGPLDAITGSLATNPFAEFGLPTADSKPQEITLGPDGNLWFTEGGANRLGRIDADGHVVEYLVPTADADLVGIAPGPEGTDTVWFTEAAANQVARVSTSAASVPGVFTLDPTSGPSTGGTTVTVTGGGLAGVTAVRFGDVAATSFTPIDDGHLTAVSPTLPGGRFPIIATTAEGTSGVTDGALFTSLAPLAVTALAPDESDPDGGGTVTIIGSGFTTATKVLFGDVEAEFSNDSDAQITATIPAHEGNGIVDVVVQAAQGTSPITAADRFTYLDRPVIGSVYPAYGPWTGGAVVVVRGRRLTGATAVTFGDESVPCPARCTVVSDNELAVSSPPHGIGVVGLSVTTPSATSVGTATFAYHGVGSFRPAGTCAAEGCSGRGATLVALPDGRILTGDLVYDPRTDAWSEVAPCECTVSDTLTLLPAGPPALCGANCGKVLGTAGGGGSSAALFDPASDTWRPTAPMNVGRRAARAVLLGNGRVLVASGDGPPEVFDPVTETWSPTGPMAVAGLRSIGLTALRSGRVLASGGTFGGTNGLRATAQILDPDAIDIATGNRGVWTLAESLHAGRFSHTSTLLPDGRVLVTGGQRTPMPGDRPVISSAEIFDPGTGHWSNVASMAFARGGHGAAVLPNGKVLVVGGDRLQYRDYTLGASGVAVGNNPTVGELFDPAANSWTPTPPALVLGEAPGGVAAVLIPPGPSSVCGATCGRALLIDSFDRGVPASATRSMLYDPKPELSSVSPATVPATGGAVVTLSGTGLAGASAVTFGGTPGTALTPDPANPDSRLTVVAPPQSAGATNVVVTTKGGTASATFTFQTPAVTPTTTTPTTTTPSSPVVVPTLTAPLANLGYSLVSGDGGVFNFGTLPFLGSLGSMKLNQPIVAIEHTSSGRGYWLVGADGGVFAFGDARFHGSTGGIRLAKPIVGMKATRSGNGYWLVASDGGVFAFGDARFFGSTGAIRLAGPVVGLERSASGNGYWLVGSDGGIFAFGDAAFRGSTGAIRLVQPVVAMARSAGGNGYWLVASDGGVFAFGDATYHGSTGALRLNSPIVGAAPATSGSGYVLCARDGGVFAFGAASFAGSVGGTRLAQPVVGCGSPRTLLTP